MEEPPFIKCESKWLPVATAKFSNFDSEVQLPFNNPVVVKDETHHALDNPCVEEESTNFVKEEFDIENVKSETLDEEYDISGVLVNNDKNSPPDNVDNSQCEEKNKLLHKISEESTSLKTCIPEHSERQAVHCTRCNRLVRPRNLKRHMKTHKQEQSYCCTKCGKIYSLNVNLTIHMPVHSHERPHSCSTCGKSFRRKSYLKRHLAIHSANKLVCNDCGKTFNRRLNIHVLPF